MASESPVYFRCEWLNLKDTHGNDAIISPEIEAGIDSAEVSTRTLTERRIMRALGLPKTGTQSLFRIGQVTGTGGEKQNWVRTIQATYDAVVSALTTNETGTYTTTMPVGFGLTGSYPEFRAKARRKTIFEIADSIGFGTAPTQGLPKSPISQMMPLLDTAAIPDITEPTDRGWIGSTWASCNLALGSSSFANTVGSGATIDRTTYPRPFILARNQRFLSLALNGTESVAIYMPLATNDIAYDRSQTAANVWARTTTYVGQLVSEFPNVKIVLGTLIRRRGSEPAYVDASSVGDGSADTLALNSVINSYNQLLRSNYLSIGAHAYVDREASHASFSTTTGTCGYDSAVFEAVTTGGARGGADGVHPNNFGSLKLAQAMQSVFQSLSF